MSPFKGGSFVVCLFLLNCCGPNTVQGQMNFSLENLAGELMLPLVGPLGAIARKAGCLLGNGVHADNNQDDQDYKPRHPPFPFYDLWEINWLMDSVLSRVEDELSLYAETLSPFALTREVIENNVVLSSAEFRGLFEVKQVSGNNHEHK